MAAALAERGELVEFNPGANIITQGADDRVVYFRLSSSGNRKMGALFRKWGGKGRAMRHRIATYIAKYIGKDADASTFNKKRYWTSRGIVVPEVEPYAHLGAECSAKDAIIEAHRAVLLNGSTCEGAQFYWNAGIGVFGWRQVIPLD